MKHQKTIIQSECDTHHAAGRLLVERVWIKPRGVQVKQEFGWFAWVAASKSWSWPFKHQRIRIPITHGGIEFNKCTTRIGIHCLPVSSVFSGLATLKIHGKKNPSKSTKWSSNSNLLELSHWCPWKSGRPRSHSWVWRVAKSNTYI